MAMATNADNQQGDPFERAMAREQAYRERRGRNQFLFPPPILRWIPIGVVAAWGVLLAIHWMFLQDPRWLAVLHTMVYGIGVIYAGVMFAAFIYMRRKSEQFGISSDDG